MNLKFVLTMAIWTIGMFLYTLPLVFATDFFPVSLIVVGIYVAGYAVGVQLLYKRFIKKVKPHYPLAFPGNPDSYFPRFDIPRPLYLDMMEHPDYFEKAEEAESGGGK